MNILKSLVVLLFVSVFAFANSSNSTDKNVMVLETLYDKIITKDVKSSLDILSKLHQVVENKEQMKSKELFSNLVTNWKSVETFYILGELNEDFIDTPRYIDIFHNGNEDIKKQLDRAIKSEDELRIALFKNSLKSINALEYILYKKDITKTRVNAIALKIIERITYHLTSIDEEYINQKANFLSKLKKANAITINAIIQNSFKLKEWRVGDVAGYTKKYQNKPDIRRAEYFISGESVTAIKAVLNTYKNVLDNPNYYDYGDYLIELTDGSEMKRLRDALDTSIKLVSNMSDADLLKAKALYENINTIHVILFVEMLEELSINAKIMDADGD